MTQKNTLRNDPELIRRISAHVATENARISQIDYNSQIIWIKKREHLSLRYRLQKGNAARSFKAEQDAMLRLTEIGIPVPEVVASGPDFIATRDSGQPLNHMLWLGTGGAVSRALIFKAAGKALALMHTRHISHGRPAIKDICWQDGQITFLDFERYSAKRNTPHGHMQDLVIMVFSAIATTGKMCPEIEAMIAGYRAHDPDHIWERAEKWCQKMRWVNWVTKPIQWRGEGKASEFKAIPLTLKTFGGDV